MAFLRTGFLNRGNGNPDDEGVYADTVRFAFWAATSGATGVGQAGDLRVTAAGVPAAQVFVQPGAALIESKFAGSQSYAVMNDAAVALAVPANASGAVVTWQVIVRVRDAQYAGEAANDGTPVLELVGALPTTKPHVHLATITMPANTGVVAPSQITDRRKLANPRTDEDVRVVVLPTSKTSEAVSVTAESGEQWPNEGLFSFDVPKWATSAIVEAVWSEVVSPATATTAKCALWAEIGWGRADVVNTDFLYTTTGGDGAYRKSIVLPGRVNIPSTMRGLSVSCMMKARLVSGVTANSPRMTGDGAASLRIKFIEAPTQDM